VTGYVVDNIDAAVDAIPRAMELDPAGVRRRFEARFAAERMAKDYLTVYRTLVEAAAVPEIEVDLRRRPAARAGLQRTHPAEPGQYSHLARPADNAWEGARKND